MRPTTKGIIAVATTGAALALIYEYILNPLIVTPVKTKIETTIE